MSKIVGIDLGTTHSLVAMVDSGIPLVLADAEGRRLTPSVVHFPESGSPLTGWPAQRVAAAQPRHTIYSVKRFMGRRHAELTSEDLRVVYPVEAEAASGSPVFPLHGRSYTPEDVSAEILKKLKADAERALGESVDRAVITVPAYFNDAQRTATKRAGEAAGFCVERIINEPTAAALAYGLQRLGENARVAVYDLGGGTFDVSILELRQGVFQVLATHGNTRLGGDDLDRRVSAWLAEKILAVGGPDLRRAVDQPSGAPLETLTLVARVRAAAQEAKIELSTAEQTEIALPFLTPSFSFSSPLARADLEKLTRDLVNRTREYCLRALGDAGVSAQDLNQVILVGGQTRMPLVRRCVAEWFGCRDFEEVRGDLRLGHEYHRSAGPQLNTSVHPDEAVALGAAIQAEVLAGGLQGLVLLDVTPLSLGLQTFGGLMNVIIPRNSTIPVKAGEVFTTAVDGQRSMLIEVLQGERERAKDNWSLGRLTVEFEPAPRGVARVGVQFEIDANGILRVLARNLATGEEKVLELEAAVDVDEAAVQAMVEESVEHAFEDLAARRWIEGKQSAEQVLEASEKALQETQSELEPEYRAQVERAIQELRQAMTEHPQTNTGDLGRLQQARARLDEVTQPLADLLMDRAMEAMLRQQGLIQTLPPDQKV